jgi:hypothetical protein
MLSRIVTSGDARNARYPPIGAATWLATVADLIVPNWVISAVMSSY